MSLTTIRQALADALEGVEGLTVSPYVTDQVLTPHAMVALRGIDYDLVFGRGADTYNFVVSVYVSRTLEDEQQALLDRIADPTDASCLKALLEADAVVSAAGVDYIRVRSVNQIDEKLVGALPYLFVDYELEVVV